MKVEELKINIESSSKITFALSGGPGGQNVNKVNTKAVIHLPLDALTVLTENEIEIVKEKLKNRINSEGCLVVESSITRSQFRNRQKGLKVIEELIVSALEKKPERKNTGPSRASVRRRLNSKKHRGMIKKNRGNVTPDQ